MFSNKADKVLLSIFIVMILWLLMLQILNLKFTIYNYADQVIMGFIPSIGAIVGFIRMQQWGGIRSKVGRSVFFISLGLLSWAIGQWIWTYYNLFLNVEVPYPSWADFGYGPTYIWWAIGIAMLANLTSVKNYNRSLERILLLCVPITMAIIIYYIIYSGIHDGEGFLNTDNPVKLFFDIYYPLSDVIIMIIIILTSSLELNHLGHRVRLPFVIIMAGLISMYVSDFTFSYTTTVGTYYIGAAADWLFAISMFLLSLGLSNLHPHLLEDKS